MTRGEPSPQLHEPVVAPHRLICLRCWLPSTLSLLRDGRPGQVERCLCGRIPREVKEARLPDDGPIWEWERRCKEIDRTVLCLVCAAADLPQPSRWSHLVCDRCTPLVRGLNNLLGRVAVPVGSHSIVNLIRPVADPTALPDASWTAARILTGEATPPPLDPISDSFRALQSTYAPRWRHLARRIHQNVEAARARGLLNPDGDDLPRAAYVAAAQRLPIDHDAALLDLAGELSRDGNC